MKVTILGSGSSGGVPLIGCDCHVCTSEEPKNKRTRVSVLVEYKETKILIDTSPDLRQQALANHIKSVDAVLYTHAHADHTHGIDELRSFNFHRNAQIPIYGDKPTLEEVTKRFDYVFGPPMPEYGWFRASLVPHEITAYQPFSIDDIEVVPFAQDHGRSNSMGFRIGDFAYSTDAKHIPEASFEVLNGVKYWIVDCLSRHAKPTHAHLDLALEWIARVKPEKAILTHMGHDFEYHTLKVELPSHIEPAYDNLSFEL